MNDRLTPAGDPRRCGDCVSWLILTVGAYDDPGLALGPGERATRDYYAQNRATVVDAGRLDAARERRPPSSRRSPSATSRSRPTQEGLSQIFERMRAGVPAAAGGIAAVDITGTTPGRIAPGDTL